jgi:DNA invertase Pin-like site-specific DNA recombinase
MKVAIYARVSTDRGEQDPQVQVEILRRYLGALEHEVAEVFVDHVSGAKTSRPALDGFLARLDEFDAVAIVKLDRLARSLPHLIELVQMLESNGVDLIVKDQAIDTSTPAGRLMFHVVGAFAQFERDLISERTKAGVGACNGFSRRGNRLGQPRVKIDVVYAAQLCEELGSVKAAAAEMGVARSTLRDHLVRAGLVAA